MVTWKSAVFIAVVLVTGGALYIRLHWRRWPQAYRAMIGLTACYFIAGSVVGPFVLHFIAPRPSAPIAEIATPSAGVLSPAVVAVAPTLEPGSSLPSSAAPVSIPALHYDPARAVLPDPKRTPGDVFPNATKDDVCTPGWASEHRHVTESDWDRVLRRIRARPRAWVLRSGSLGAAGTRRLQRHQEPLAAARRAAPWRSGEGFAGEHATRGGVQR